MIINILYLYSFHIVVFYRLTKFFSLFGHN